MPNGHGGKRNNAGKKKWNDPTKKRKDQPVLNSFFPVSKNPTNLSSSSSTRSATRASTPAATRASIPAATRASIPTANRASTPSATRASTPSATRASTPSATRASTPVANRASTPVTNRASTPVANRASTPAANRASTPAANRASTPSANTTSSSTSDHRANPAQNTASSQFRNLPRNDVDSNSTEFQRGKRIAGSKNLRSQQNRIMEKSYRENAFRAIHKEGVFWDHPPSLVLKALQLKSCWTEFFKLSVFNWIPEAILGSQWKPHCPCCKRKLTRWGVTKKPRLVFGQCRNYWLNAPQVYICENCRDANAEAKRKGQAPISYQYYDTSEEVLKQIDDVSPELYQVFPCHLTKRNAIDKELMNLIIHCAVKGIGPAAMSENISSWHELEWQKGENRHLAYLHGKLKQPSANQRPIRREDIEKCPEYFSTEMGGCVPSGTWLIEMFCILIRRMRPYLDSECLKRAKSTRVLSIDASYKIIKWMMMWGSNERVYNALISGSNEYNEIPMHFFATSDNHREIKLNLEALARHGLNPFLVFSDDPGRDEGLLKSIFSNLNNAHDDQSQVVEIPQNLTELTSEKNLIYLYDIDRASLMLSKFRQDVEDALENTADGVVRIAFDVEWPMYQGQYTNKGTKGDVNIITIGSNKTDYTLLLELYSFRHNRTHMNRIGQKLKAIFQLKVNCFTGCRQKADYTLLQKQYPMFDLPDSARDLMDDVSIMAVNRKVAKRGCGTTTLQALCRGQGLHLKKPQNVRVGTTFDSRNGSLSEEARSYCQLDVEAPLLLHSIYSGIPDFTMRATTMDLPVGTVVDIMPSLASALDPIAQGVLKQLGGTVWNENRMKIGKDKVLVQVTKVFDGRGIIHYPSTSTHRKKCACGRATHGKIGESCNFYLFAQLGKPPYELIELKSRLRKKIKTHDYPSCIYESDAAPAIEIPTPSPDSSNVLDPEEDDGEARIGDDEQDDKHDESDDNVADLNIDPQVLQALTEDDTEEDELFDAFFEDICNPTEAQVRIAESEDWDETFDKLLEEADKLSVHQHILQPNGNDDDLPVEELSKKATWKTVLGDIFHFMDRAKLPMHHEYKALFFRALRAAMFILNRDDVDQVKEVLKKKEGASWNKTLAFNFRYIAERVRRIVPPPEILYNRMVAVFNFFKDKKDMETGHTLFHETNKKKFENMLVMIKKGYASDPQGLMMYLPKTDRFGREMVDKDGLRLYRSIRGTSNLESIHQYLTTSFGHTMAGPWYSDCLLAILRHFFNWRMSRKNRPHFPNISHYDGLLLDRANYLYELVFGYRKHRNWSDFNANIPVESCYGIVPIDSALTSSLTYSATDITQLSKNHQLAYLAERQKSTVPFMPIRGVNEKKLVHKKLSEIVASNVSMGSQAVYDGLADDWNTHHISIKDKTYPKLSQHFSKYLKGWKKNQGRKDAEVASGASRVFEVLEYIPATAQIHDTFQPTNISNDTNISTDTNETPIDSTGKDGAQQDPTEDVAVLDALASAACRQDPIPTQDEDDQDVEPKKKKRKYKTKTCQGYQKQPCPDPMNCPGKSFKPNCLVRTGGDPSKMIKREIKKKYERTCQECNTKGCPGSQNRSECMYK